MWVLAVEAGAGDRDLVLAELYERGTLGVVEHDRPGGGALLEAFFDDRFDADGFAAFRPVWTERAADVDSWRAGWEPLCVGERFFLVPDWRGDPAPEGRLRLTIHARQASGSGYHAPTQLMLCAMEGVVRGGSFLDVGTGSGILCDAARLLGAEKVWGCDIDSEALAEARENGTGAELFVGSARAVRDGVADVVVANLNAEALVALGADLMRVVPPGGVLVVSGFKQRRLDPVVGAFAAMRMRETHAQGDWRCVVFERV